MFSIFWNRLFQESQTGLSAERIHRENHKLLASSSPSRHTQRRSVWWPCSVELDPNFPKRGLSSLSGSCLGASLTTLRQRPAWFPVSPAAGRQRAAPFLQHGRAAVGLDTAPSGLHQLPTSARRTKGCVLLPGPPPLMPPGSRRAACPLPCPCASRGGTRPGAVGFWQVGLTHPSKLQLEGNDTISLEHLVTALLTL